MQNISGPSFKIAPTHNFPLHKKLSWTVYLTYEQIFKCLFVALRGIAQNQNGEYSGQSGSPGGGTDKSLNKKNCDLSQKYEGPNNFT